MADVSRNRSETRLPERANIRTVKELQPELLAALLGGDAVVLDITACREVDFSFVQMIEAARLYARVAGKTLALSAPAEGAVLDVLRRAGFLDQVSPEHASFWLHREV